MPTGAMPTGIVPTKSAGPNPLFSASRRSKTATLALLSMLTNANRLFLDVATSIAP